MRLPYHKVKKTKQIKYTSNYTNELIVVILGNLSLEALSLLVQKTITSGNKEITVRVLSRCYL